VTKKIPRRVTKKMKEKENTARQNHPGKTEGKGTIIIKNRLKRKGANQKANRMCTSHHPACAGKK